MAIDIKQLDSLVAGKAPQEIIQQALEANDNAFITTNFGPYSSVLLHMLTQVKPDIPVVWIDSGLNKPETYEFAETTIEELDLNIKIYTPRITAARLEAVMGGIPGLNESRHEDFTEQFKLEPFKRAMKEHQGSTWFSAVRREQTKVRASMDYVSAGPFGLSKVAPLLDWTQDDMEQYIDAFDLPNETEYFDPTKAQAHRECGLHTLAVEH
ncbi:phosphoadenosine phosphosulfate reductase family protein [Leucothrix pacifica]|uniref:Phosphoadenylylsulfate reductase n=1 Tax=Leucothrix pacifica TaxID=1247513 RepID=A0A317CRG8_9GAMM|nr:phosphoadenosine phosphosulfate reductase family protein [Leucothrix pacifica]PWR00682.1 phosphoadenylylsulfate reductase [Leucothrix pacifica]